MKTRGVAAVAVTLILLCATPVGAQPAPFRSAEVRQLAASPLMKAISSAAVYRSAEKVTQFKDGLAWINETRTRNTYQGGLLVTKYEDMWVGAEIGDWEPTMRYEYTYGAGASLASETTYEWNGTEWAPFERIVYEGENGIYTRVLTQAPSDATTWVDVEQETYTIENGLVVAGQTDLMLGAWTPTERFTFEETNEGVYETTFMPDGAGWMNSERTLYHGLSLFYLHQEFQRLLDEITELGGMYYAIRFPAMTTQNWDGTDWFNETRIDIDRTYQVQTGYIIDETTVTEDWDGAAWVPSTKTVTTFVLDDALSGLPSGMSLQMFDGSGWVEFGKEHYILQNGVKKIVQSTLSLNLGAGFDENARVRVEWVQVASVGVENPETPATFTLDQNFPNPFNPSTRISYSLSQGQDVQLTVYDALGRRIELLDSGFRPAGEHAITWDASDMPSGMYVYRLETAGGIVTKTMALLK